MKITFIGHSHLNCIMAAQLERGAEFQFVRLHQFKREALPGALNLSPSNVDHVTVSEAVRSAVADASEVVLCIAGNAPSLFGLRGIGRAGAASGRTVVSANVRKQLAGYMTAHDQWLELLGDWIDLPMRVIPPPPPVKDNLWILANPGSFVKPLERFGASDPAYRLELYQLWTNHLRKTSATRGMRFTELPRDVFDDSGFLAVDCLGDEPSHAGVTYGMMLIEHFKRIGFVGPASSRHHPYMELPDRAFWKQAVADVPLGELDPVMEVPFRISRTDRVATAGSCFAQHISKRLKTGGFQFMTMEDPACDGSVGDDFSARYGNIYTARQLDQLFDRAFGEFVPKESSWHREDGKLCDPFRPTIKKHGYESSEELAHDRQSHLAAVRRMFSELDVFVFTLGLTECWISRVDGAAFPLAPGVAGGTYNPECYQFVNFGPADVARDMCAFIRKLRLINPGAKLVLTVSPVPLAATREPRHVLVSNTWSKAALRVAAQDICSSGDDIYYFPSYEIITGNHQRGRYFGPDLRSVTEEGVNHVMRVFMRHMTDAETEQANGGNDAEDPETEEMMRLAESACDEELLERR